MTKGRTIRLNERRAKEWGLKLCDSKKEWDSPTLSFLLDCYLENDPFVRQVGDGPCLCRTFKRSVGALNKAISRIATRSQDRKAFANLIRQHSLPSSRPWVSRDSRILLMATSPSGIANKAYEVEYLATILTRRETEVKAKMHYYARMWQSHFLVKKRLDRETEARYCHLQLERELTPQSVQF